MAQTDVACGPRCVANILESYGHEASFEDIAQELLPADTSRGVDLQSIATYLKSNGLYTQGLKVSPNQRIVWQEPVILHLKGIEGQLGHYVVLHDAKATGPARIWNGLSGYEIGSFEGLASLMSGNVLLTSAEPFGPKFTPTAAVKIPSTPKSLGIFALVFINVSLALWIGRLQMATT